MVIEILSGKQKFVNFDNIGRQEMMALMALPYLGTMGGDEHFLYRKHGASSGL